MLLSADGEIDDISQWLPTQNYNACCPLNGLSKIPATET